MCLHCVFPQQSRLVYSVNTDEELRTHVRQRPCARVSRSQPALSAQVSVIVSSSRADVMSMSSISYYVWLLKKTSGLGIV